MTIAYYCVIHLSNAHIAHVINQHYRTHAEVGKALNPYVPVNPSAISPDAYGAYQQIQNLSRRSRYLCDVIGSDDTRASFTSDKHFAKAIRNLNTLQIFYSNRYNKLFTPITLDCPRLKQDPLQFIVIK